MGEVKVLKVPLHNPQEDLKQSFPFEPQLYLEFLENKAKVLDRYANVTYDPVLAPVRDDGRNRRGNIRDLSDDSDGGSSSDDSDDSDNIPNRNNEYDDHGGYDSDDSNEAILNKLKDLQESDDQFSDYDNRGNQEDDHSVMSFGGKGGHRGKRRPRNMPPTYDELNTGNGGIQDLSYSPPNAMAQNDRKRELLFKFEMLKKMYKNNEIPKYTMHSSVDDMERDYDHWLRTLTVDSNINSYKTYLITGFGVMEQVLSKVFNFDANGYTKQQILMMDSYEKILIEIGQDNYTPQSKKFPAYVRLSGLIAFNTATFVVTKMIFSSTGTNIMNMTSGINTTTAPPHIHKTMKGPTIDLDDI